MNIDRLVTAASSRTSRRAQQRTMPPSSGGLPPWQAEAGGVWATDAEDIAGAGATSPGPVTRLTALLDGRTLFADHLR